MVTPSKETRIIYRNFRAELIGLQFRINVYKQLYTIPSSFDLVMEKSPRFFATLLYDLLDAIVISITRLIDPAKTFNKYPNASLQQLIDTLEDNSHYSILKNQLQDKLDLLKINSMRIKKWRDKWVSHRDLDILLGKSTKPAISLVEIQHIFSELQEFINLFENDCQDPRITHEYDVSISIDEFVKNIIDWEEIEIYQPIDYQNMIFLDDGNTIIKLLKGN